jgi:hypothetical protein
VEYQFEDQSHMWAEVQNMLDSPGWVGYIVPSLNEILRSDLAALMAAKRGETPDDYLRGRIALANNLLTLLPIKVREFREKQAQQELFGPDGQPIGQGEPYGDNPGPGQPATN